MQNQNLKLSTWLTPELTNEIMALNMEIKQGLFIENDHLEKEIEEWLNEK